MGIPSYFSYIIKNHVKLIKKLSKNTIPVNNLYLDCNSIIYDAVHNIDFTKLVASDIDTIIASVCSKIDEYILELKPDNIVYIAFDGVPPYAKISQQKNRRYKSAYQSALFKTDVLWDSCAITPGTNFMKSLNTALISHIKYHNYYNSINIIIK